MDLSRKGFPYFEGFIMLYQVSLLFYHNIPEDWLNHSSILSFPEGWHSHSSTVFIMWIALAFKTTYLHFRGLA